MRYTVYVLKCKTRNHYYVGITRDFKHRLNQHKRGAGAAFTQKHGVQKVILTKEVRGEERAQDLEKAYTDHYVRIYGKKNVAGYAHTRSDW